MKILLYNTFYCSGLGKYKGQNSSEFFRLFFSSKKTLKTIGDFIARCNPDIIGLTEIDKGSLKSCFIDQINYISSTSGCKHIASRCKYRPKSFLSKLPIFSQLSNAILSKMPFTSATFYDVSVGRKRLIIHVFYHHLNLHIFLVHFSLLKKNRKKQLYELSNLVKKVNGNVIVMGDFNAKHQGDLLSLASENNLIFADQSNHKTFPSFKPKKCLDYILVSHGIRIKKFQVFPVKYSDHLPILFEFDVV